MTYFNKYNRMFEVFLFLFLRGKIGSEKSGIKNRSQKRKKYIRSSLKIVSQ